MKELLENEYNKLKNRELSPTGRVNIINNIIQIKLNENSLIYVENDLSVDIKIYLNSLINLAENGARNYDMISENKVLELTNNFDYDDKVIYINYFIRLLEKSAFNDELSNFQKLRYKTIIEKSLKECNLLNLLIYFPLLNIYTLGISLFIITLLINVVLLPAPYEWMQLLNFKIEYLNLSQNFYINHVVNITSALVGTNGEFKITPQSIISMIVSILGKIFFFSYVSTLIFNKLTDLIKR